MGRIALVLVTAGVIAFDIAGTPAQAHNGWGYGPQQWHENQSHRHEWREHEWREHEWRGHREPHVTIIRGAHISNR